MDVAKFDPVNHAVVFMEKNVTNTAVFDLSAVSFECHVPNKKKKKGQNTADARRH